MLFPEWVYNVLIRNKNVSLPFNVLETVSIKEAERDLKRNVKFKVKIKYSDIYRHFNPRTKEIETTQYAIAHKC